eukprot:3598725-Alexandrium_andersonii.AAC.1
MVHGLPGPRSPLTNPGGSRVLRWLRLVVCPLSCEYHGQMHGSEHVGATGQGASTRERDTR